MTSLTLLSNSCSAVMWGSLSQRSNHCSGVVACCTTGMNVCWCTVYLTLILLSSLLTTPSMLCRAVA